MDYVIRNLPRCPRGNPDVHLDNSERMECGGDVWIVGWNS